MKKASQEQLKQLDKPFKTLKMTPFQLHYGRKPRTPIPNLNGQPACLLTDWKKTITNYILAQPAELQVYTIQDSDGELADYLVLNESRKRGRSVSGDFKSGANTFPKNSEK